jgi:hypothetical protein
MHRADLNTVVNRNGILGVGSANPSYQKQKE